MPDVVKLDIEYRGSLETLSPSHPKPLVSRTCDQLTKPMTEQENRVGVSVELHHDIQDVGNLYA